MGEKIFMWVGFFMVIGLIIYGGTRNYRINIIELQERGMVRSVEIVSAKDRVDIHGEFGGSFLFFGGKIDQQDYYIVFAKCGNGVKKVKIPAYGWVVIESDSVPRLEWSGQSSGSVDPMNANTGRMYVPKGSVMVNYKIE